VTELTDKGAAILDDMPYYAQTDPVIRAFINAVGAELKRIEDYLLDLRERLIPINATEDLLRYWEEFLDLPVQPDGVSVERREATVQAAIIRRTAGAGQGWYDLLSSVLAPATWRHAENTDAAGAYAPYEIAFTDIAVLLRADTTVNGTQTGLPSTGATLTVASTTGFAPSGTIYVDEVAITFTGTTATTFTGVAGLPSSVAGGTAVVQRGDYRVGVFEDMSRRLTPAHIEISETDIAGTDTFRTGISIVGDEI
jgi:hypothetical protein